MFMVSYIEFYRVISAYFITNKLILFKLANAIFFCMYLSIC